MANWRKKNRSSTNFVDPLSKEVLAIRIYIRSYQLDEKQPIRQSHVQRSSATATAIFPSLPFWSRFNGCACARTNREQASRSHALLLLTHRAHACARASLTRGRARRARASSDTRCVARHRRARTS